MNALTRRLRAAIGERFALQVVRLLSRLALGLFAILLGFFVLERVIPDEPARVLAPPGALAAEIAGLHDTLDLDAPLPSQFAGYALRVLSGDLGVSNRTQRPVAVELLEALPGSLAMLVLASLSGAAIGLALVLLSTAGLVFRLLLAALAVAGAVPVFASAAVAVLTAGSLRGLPGPLPLVLGAGVLGLPLAQEVARTTRISLAAVMLTPYIRAARASGLSNFRAALRHGLRNALRQPLSAFAVHAGAMMAGLMVVERLLGRPGLGSYLLDAIAAHDTRAAMGACMVFSVVYLAIDLITAVLRVYVDPRLRLE